MLSSKLYSSENVARAKYAQMIAVISAAIICGYLLFTTVFGTREIWQSQAMLKRGKTEKFQLAREANQLKAQEAKLTPPANGGVEAFAVELSKWANQRGLQIDSLVPEGAPAASEVTIDNIKLGTWAANQVRIQGQGQFDKFMDLLDQLRRPNMPIQLTSFTLQSPDGVEDAMVSFDLVLTVYEKKNGTS